MLVLPVNVICEFEGEERGISGIGVFTGGTPGPLPQKDFSNFQ